MGNGGGGDEGSAVVSVGRDSYIGNGGFDEDNCCRYFGVIREIWEDLPYNVLFFLEFHSNERGGWG